MNYRCVYICAIFLLPVSVLNAAVPEPDDSERDEIFLELQVEKLLSFDIDGYLEDDHLYLPVKSLLSKLDIDYTSDSGANLQAGHPDGRQQVKVRFPRGTAEAGNKRIELSPADWFTNSAGEIFLEIDRIEEIFDLSIRFSHSNLVVSVSSPHELPVIKNYSRRKQYADFSPGTDVLTPDYIYAPRRYVIRGSRLDWAVNSSHYTNRQNYSYSLGYGNQLLGGEAFISFRGNTDEIVNQESIRGNWRLPVYGTPLLRQVNAGDQYLENLYSHGTLQYRGIEITNSPRASRRIFGTFHSENELPEHRDIEFYSNSRMTGLARGNETGDYQFSGPLTYGSNKFTLKEYNSDGLADQKNYYIVIPKTLLPAGEVEYSLSAGQLRHYDHNFARADVGVGINSFLTMGGGAEAVADAQNNPEYTPYINAAMRLGNRILLDGSHTLDYVSRGTLRYIFPSARSITFQAQKYHQSTLMNRSGKQFEASINTSFPVPMPGIRLLASINARNVHYTSIHDILLNGSLKAFLPLGFQALVRSKTHYRGSWPEKPDLIRSDVSYMISKRFRRLLLRPALDYNHYLGQITGYRIDARTRIFRNGELNISARYDARTEQTRIFGGFRFNFPFARHQSRVNSSGSGNVSYSQTTSGSMAWDRQGDLFADYRAQRNKTILKIEPYIPGASEEANKAIRRHSKQLNVTIYDELSRARHHRGNVVKDLYPYRDYLVEVSADNFDNPLWELQSHTYSITMMPNVINYIRVPITAVGEVAGKVELPDEDIPDDLPVVISSIDGSFSETVSTYSAGYFYYVGLQPGNYTAMADTRSLDDENIDTKPISFTIESTFDGDIVDGLNLVVSRTDTAVVPLEIFSVQIGAFKQREYAVQLTEYIKQHTNVTLEIVFDPQQQLYKCHTGLFSSYQGAKKFLENLKQEHPSHFDDAFIIWNDYSPEENK